VNLDFQTKAFDSSLQTWPLLPPFLLRCRVLNPLSRQTFEHLALLLVVEYRIRM
jgi:hypothetical protein